MNVETVERFVIGTVISNKMDKTVVVQLVGKKKHPLYGKYVKYRTKYYAHDDANVCEIGDVVKLLPTRPLSKSKRWVVSEVVQKSKDTQGSAA